MKYLFLVLVMLASSIALADETEKTYVMFCGNKAALEKMAAEEGFTITKEDLLEMNETRAPILDILKNGAEGIERQLELGNSQDTGAFGVIISCGMIDQVKDLIKKKGCFDLKTNKVVKDKGGIAACAEIMAKLPR